MKDHTSTEQPDINELCQWFNEGDGFNQGNAAPHKWVLQANSEISRLHSRVQELEAENHRLIQTFVPKHKPEEIYSSGAAQAPRFPLTFAQYDDLLSGLRSRMGRKPLSDDISLLRAIEAAHGITQEKQGCGNTR
jgi:hypothetical protein